MHLQENTLFYHFYINLRVKAIQNITQYPLHYEIYASAKFEVAALNSLGEGFHILTKEGWIVCWQRNVEIFSQ